MVSFLVPPMGQDLRTSADLIERATRNSLRLADSQQLASVALPAYRGHGEHVKADEKPWDGAEGLEWTVPSPAPFHTFEILPRIK